MNIQLIIVTVYMVLLLGASWWITKLKKSGESASNFLLAGQQLPWYLVAVTVAGLAIGGAATVGVAENAYTRGISAGWYTGAWAITTIFYGIMFAKKYRSLTVKTVNELVSKVYGSKIGLVTLSMQLVFNFAMNAMQIVAGGAILTALLPGMFKLDTAMLVSTVIFLAVASVGGLWAASLSNMINVIVIYVGIILGVVFGVNKFGGMTSINATLPTGGTWYEIVGGMGITVVMAWIVSLIFSATTSQALVQTSVSALDGKTAKKGFLFAALIIFPVGFIAAMFGVIAASKIPGLESAKLALPSVLMQINPIVSGFTLAALWAADVSTSTVLLVSQSTMLTRDVVVKYFKPDLSDKHQIVVSRLFMGFVSFLGYLLATRVTSILKTITTFMAVMSPLAVVIFVTLYLPKYARKNTATLVYLFGMTAFILVAGVKVIPAVGGHPIYVTAIASIFGWILSVLTDKREVDTSVLVEKPLDNTSVSG